ncbi:hypothetical protein JCM16303_005327 [Sporobolomyces ruberrimus]
MSTSSTQDLIGPSKTKFFTKTWLPAKGTPTVAVVLFIHGFVEHVRRYDHVFPMYADKGIAVFAYDQRGFGQTAFYTPKHTQGQTSWPQQFTDIDHFASYTRSLFPSPLPFFLMGHSMGGALSLAYPTRQPRLPNFDSSRFSGIISTSPLIRQAPAVKAPGFVLKLGSVVGKVFPNLPLSAKVKPEDTCRDPEIQKAYSEDKLCKQQGSFGGVGSMLVGGEGLVRDDWRNWPKGTPLLVAHGESDRVTDHEASKEFVEKVRSLGNEDTTYKGFGGYFHEMQNEPGQDKIVFINYIIDWILSHAQASTHSSPAQPSAIDTTTPAIQVSPASPVVVGGEEDVGARESKL